MFPVSGGSTALIAATCRRVGTHAYVFVENRQWDTNGGSILQSHVDALGALFDDATPADPARGVYQLEVETFGAAPDVDNDARIFLLVLNASNPNLVGYFDRGVATHPVPEYRRDVLFLDETFLRRDNRLALGTLAHEFQHLIHWNWDDDEDIWIDEGLSGFAEELAGFPEADPEAVPQFLSRPHTSLTDWNFGDSAPHYGVTYLFMSYLAQRFGNQFIATMVAEPRNGPAGVDAALQSEGLSPSFGDAWSQWAVGNYASQDERYAYAALGPRRVQTLDVDADDLPLQDAAVAVSGQWGTANILFRTPGDLRVDFDGDDAGLYTVTSYAMGAAGADAQTMSLGAGNRGVVQLTGIDSAVVIVGRRSAAGQNFLLSAAAQTPTLVADGGATLPATAALQLVYPNPFNSSVHIPYVLTEAGDVDLAIYDLAGQQVRRLVAARRTPGRYETTWDGQDTAGRASASGTYMVRLRSAGRTHVSTLSLVR